MRTPPVRALHQGLAFARTRWVARGLGHLAGEREPLGGLVDQGLLCAAIVDRLTFHGTILQTGTDSYRLAHTKQEIAA
ncbi:hypothetical protein [Actinopolymorpha rutila]|uniref:IstB-like ATP binding protein n=1 Tax=Actinopolymorpha rutila TaxID=446787 RepID=A0A852ZCR0_9ACTN|nr:hypothetical protein [Actinopolymorpha rutila]NYH90927.1 hypothetical protein [Actinopolymorpha rutila]